MPSNKKQTPAADLSLLLKELKKAEVDFILVGGVAAVAQGAPIMTFDLDIVHCRSNENIIKIEKFLKSVNAFQRRPDEKVIEPDMNALRGKGHMLLSTCFGPLDILAVIEKGLGYDELLKNTVEIEFQNFKIHVLSLETIIDLKKKSKRPDDQYRLQILEETLRQAPGTDNIGVMKDNSQIGQR
ncbi:MAG: hypothetical protein DRH93_20640 [Deltaproteobacteria bacterium]|nr:MAG: hypothetical protein DRH93_20640 [Deltaproteobacteria bacterium]